MTIAELYRKLDRIERQLAIKREELEESKLESKREGAEIADTLGGTPRAKRMSDLRAEIAKLMEERREIKGKISEYEGKKVDKSKYEPSEVDSIISDAMFKYMFDEDNYMEKSSESPKKGLRGILEKFKSKNKSKENNIEKSSDTPKTELKGKPKPMSGIEIMEKYGDEVIANRMKKEREKLRKKADEEIDKQKDYLERNPYDRDVVIKNISKIEKQYKEDEKRMKDNYLKYLKEAKEYVSEFGFDHFEGRGIIK